MDCEKYQELIYLSIYGEANESEERALQRHLARCPNCRKEYARAQQLFSVMEHQRAPEIDPEWLKGARNQLLAHIETTRKKPLRLYIDWSKIFNLFRQPAFQVVYTAALVLVGIGIGRFECSAPPTTITPIKTGQMAAEYIEDDEIPELIRDGKLRNVNMEVLPDNQVQVSFQGSKEYQFTGNTHDKNIQELLAYILLNEKNDGLRMKTVETISSTPDSLVKQMLLYSLLYDSNPGLRLKSIRALKTYDSTPQLRDAYLKILMTDPNPSVRIEAMEALEEFIFEEKVRNVVNIAAAKDSNDYVKLMAEKALSAAESEPELNGAHIEDFK